MTAPAPSPDDVSLGPPPLPGRQQPLVELRERLAAAISGRGGLILLGGGAGIGKTVLMEALAGEAAALGAQVLAGRCYDLADTPPYGVWADLFDRYAPGEADPPPPDVLPRQGRATIIAAQAALFREVEDILVNLAVRRPLLVLLDDLHWADHDSVDLLRHLARGVAARPVLAIAAYRADEVDRRHPLYQLLPILVREAGAARLDLRPLDDDAVRALVAARYPLSGGESTRLVRYLQRRAEGNPLFIGELVRALAEEGTLRPVGDGWHLGDLEHAPLPPFLHQVIERRVARLDPATQALLTIAAVVGQEIPLGVWARVADTDGEALLDALDRAIEAGLLVADADGTHARFAHALIREALYERASPPRRRAWHQRTADVLLDEAEPDPDAVAYHLQRAGDARAPTWLVRAGDRAYLAYAWHTATARYEAALALLAPAADHARERGWILLRLADMRRYGDPHAALANLEEVAALAAVGKDRALAALARGARGLMRIMRGEVRAGLEETIAGVAATDTLADDERSALPPLLPPGHGRVLIPHRSALLICLAVAGRVREAAQLRPSEVPPPRMGGDAASDAMPPGEEQVASDAVAPGEEQVNEAFGLGLVAATLGRPGAARHAFARARAILRAIDYQTALGWTAANELRWVLVAYHADDPAACRKVAAEAVAAWERTGEAALGVPPRFAAVNYLRVTGDWAAARALAEAGQSANFYGWRAHAARVLGAIARDQGEAALAWLQVAAMLPDGPTTAPGDASFLDALALQRLAATLALDDGDLATAAAWLAAHDRWLAWSGAVLGQADGQLGWARYHRAAGDAETARRRATQGLALATAPRQPLALLAAHRLLGELATDSGALPEAGRYLDQALSLATACASPHELILTQLARAAYHLAGGEMVSAAAALADVAERGPALGARRALRRQAELAARLGDARPRSGPTARLTERQVGVLRLVAAGLTDAQIADRLHLARRTVSSYLTEIYNKLGVSGRAAATRVAVEQGLVDDTSG